MHIGDAVWQQEMERLSRTVQFAQQQLSQLVDAAQDQDKAMEEARESFLERVSIDIGGMDSTQGFLDLLEIGQASESIHAAQQEQKRNVQMQRVLKEMAMSPYFARIDFHKEGEQSRNVYIGRRTLMDDTTYEFYVYDWRSPIASLFYQYGVGPAHYDAPGGRIEGDITLKRQFEIQDGQLQYFFDADEQVLDSFLREMLARPSQVEMRDIVSTIQREQDAVIRDAEHDLLMVQGAAGSGKTSVALHRIAYLLYQKEQKNPLLPKDIMIISPSTVFERYISGVLPSLGERQVQTTRFDELLQAILPDVPLQPHSQWVESWMYKERHSEAAQRAHMLRQAPAFLHMLDRLLLALPRQILPFEDIDYAGACVAKRELSQAYVCARDRRVPLGIRMRMLEKAIWRQVREHRPRRMERLSRFAYSLPHHVMEAEAYARMISLRETAQIAERIARFTRVDVRALYRTMWEDETLLRSLAKGLIEESMIVSIREHMLVALSSDVLAFDDALAMAYLATHLYGSSATRAIRMIVVDEAQDMGLLHMHLLRNLFPYARFTVLGDMHQTLLFGTHDALYTTLEDVLKAKNCQLVTLDESFRCTREIFAFSRQFLPKDAKGTCFARSGDMPLVSGVKSQAEYTNLLLDELDVCKQKGYETIALLCKTEADGEAVYAQIKEHIACSFLQNDAYAHTKGITVLSLYMAKGLEFDAVIVCDADAAHYHSEEDKNLLYIACTRALHRLSVMYMGERSPLLAPGEEAS